MKSLLAMVLFISSLTAIAGEIRVKKMTRDGELERSYVFNTNLTEKVVLDCQSFIQGLRVGEFEAAYTYLLEPWECEELQKRVKSSLRKFQHHCIDVEEDIRADYTCSRN